MLVDGTWTDADPKATGTDGKFRRRRSAFRKIVGEDPDHPAESGRYRLVVAYPCPWSHRAVLTLNLTGIRDLVSTGWAESVMGPEGWEIASAQMGESLKGKEPLHAYYRRSDPHYTGPASVPFLWDEARGSIVNNESADIVGMFSSAMGGPQRPAIDLRPSELAEEIDRTCRLVHETINEGVYRAGYATTQPAYDDAIDGVFRGLRELDALLAVRRFLAGDRITLAEVYAFPTLIRFDPIYSVLMRCNLRRITEYAHVLRYLRELWRLSAFRETVDMDEYRRGYFSNLRRLNPHGIIPAGPVLEL